MYGNPSVETNVVEDLQMQQSETYTEATARRDPGRVSRAEVPTSWL